LSTAKDDGWHHTSPLAAIFYLGKIYQAIAKNAVPSLAPLVVVLFASKGDLMGKIVIGATGFFLLTVAGAILRYLFFRYRITDDSVLIREGVLKKTQIDIKFDRVQAINTRQSFIFRAFGLVTIMLDTAGSGKQEGHIPAVKTAVSDSLKERIQRTAPARSDIDEAGNDEGDESGHKGTPRRLLWLRARDIVRIGLSSNRALIFLVFLGPLLEQLGSTVEEGIEEGIENGSLAADVAQAGVTIGVGYVFMIAFAVLLFLIAASVIGAFLRYHRFELVSDNHVLRSTGGLLTRHEHSINLTKVQTVVVQQNIMLRLFRRFRLQARQASSGKAKASKSFIIPLCRADQLADLAGEIFGEEYRGAVLDPAATDFLPVAIQYFRTRALLIGVLPAVALTLALATPTGFYSLLILLWIPAAAYVSWRQFKGYGISIANDGLAVRRGFLGYQVNSFLHRKVQRISLTQTTLQRRKGLATLRFYLASGSIKLPYVDFQKACQLRDYVLYRVESSQAAWH
jgi:putative membrane protein